MRLRDDAKSWLILFAATTAAAVLLLASASLALASKLDMPAAAEEQAFRLCERATQRWERISDVPDKLLQAISLTESGRWSKRLKRVRAWPWTVTSGGPGSYFSTKAAAMTEVRRLQAKGVQNIDVGCMQVNMQYHGHEFRSVEDAMDPDINAAYAAKFLSSLRSNADSWAEAAGYYHSFTPKRTAYYRGKVEKFWAMLNNGQIEEPVYAGTPKAIELPDAEPSTYSIMPIDRTRTAALNARFKKLKTAARKLRNDLDPDARRQRQMEAWRSARGRAEQLQHLLAVRQAEIQMRREREISGDGDADRVTRFQEKRRQQLAAWRARIATGN